MPTPPSDNLSASVISNRLHLAGYTLNSQDFTRPGVRVRRGINGGVNVVAELETPEESMKIARELNIVLKDLGYETDINPVSPAIIHVLFQRFAKPIRKTRDAR